MSKRSAWTNRSALSLFSPTFVAVHYRYEHEIKRLKSVIRHTGRGIDQGSVSAADMDDNRDLEEENLKLLEELSKTKYVNKGTLSVSRTSHHVYACPRMRNNTRTNTCSHESRGINTTFPLVRTLLFHLLPCSLFSVPCSLFPRVSP